MRLILVILLSIVCYVIHGQIKFRVDSVMWSKGQTVMVKCSRIDSAGTGYFGINFRGAGRKPNLIGKELTYYPFGIMKKRKIFVAFTN